MTSRIIQTDACIAERRAALGAVGPRFTRTVNGAGKPAIWAP
jgi:hypothetical protein